MTPNPQHQPTGNPSPLDGLGALSADVVLEHTEWLRRLARSLVRDANDADDLVQDAFGALASVRKPIRDLRGFLAQTLRFQGAKRHRTDSRRRHHESLGADLSPDPVEPADRVAERMDAMRAVLDEVNHLPPAQARAIGLHYVDGLSVAEVAERTGSKPSTVRSQLARGRAALRERLDGEFGGTAAWSAILAPWCLPDAVSAGASVASTSQADIAHTKPMLSAAGGAAAGGLALMTVAKSLLVVVPILGAAGWFSLRGDAAPQASVEDSPLAAAVEAGEALRPIDETVAVMDAVPEPVGRESLGTGDPAAAVAPAERFPVEGQLVRALDGQPLSGIEVRIFLDERVSSEPGVVSAHIEDRILKAMTDADGRFEVPGKDLPPETVRIVLADGGQYLVLEEDTLEFPFTEPIAADCGPTFELRYHGAYVDPNQPATATVTPLAPGTRWIGEGTVRAGRLPWVRYSDPIGEGRAELLVRAGDDFTFGRGAVDDLTGVDQGPIDVEFVLGGAVEFRHVDSAPPKGLKVTLTPLAPLVGESKTVYFYEREARSEKLAIETHLAAGRYRWEIPFGTVSTEGELTVEAGERAYVTVGEELPQAASVAVLFDTKAVSSLDWGGWHFGVLLESDATQTLGVSGVPTATGVDGEWIVTVDELPPGTWVLAVKPPAGLEVSSILTELVPGNSPSRVVVTPVSNPCSVTVRVVHAETGEALDGATAVLMDGMDITELESLEGSEAGIHGPQSAPGDRPSLLMVYADGFQLVEHDFRPEGDEATVEIRMQPGWRTRIFAVNMVSQSFIGGLSVHVDGVRVGETGPDGVYWLSGDGPPNAVVVGKDNPDFEVVLNSFTEQANSEDKRPMPMGFPVLVRQL